jgi:hypothetical protein
LSVIAYEEEPERDCDVCEIHKGDDSSPTLAIGNLADRYFCWKNHE